MTKNTLNFITHEKICITDDKTNKKNNQPDSRGEPPSTGYINTKGSTKPTQNPPSFLLRD